MEADRPVDFDALLDQSIEDLRLKTAAHDGVWRLGEADWDIDQDAGTITFTGPNITATCPVQIIGTFNTLDDTWMWGWEHPSVEPSLQEHANLCREFGEKYGIDFLTAHRLDESSEEFAWQLTALACKLAGAQGAYRGPAGTTMVFVTFGQPRLEKS